ncbi:MAG: deoxyribonuclease IV [Candidatus Andersenbacteria bacterium]|nr:deoxyribonuclease IV [bacterium]MDZ4225528.1 deoxyribonuclease IV [Candidatus Andersenbacteria bacterium]
MAKYQRIGLHVSAAGGVENAPERAKELGAECFQFFSRSPRGGKAPEIGDEQARQFQERCEKYGMASYIHTPYYINFASKKNSLAKAAPRIVREELERGSKLGVKYVMTHLGSARDWDKDNFQSSSRRLGAMAGAAISNFQKPRNALNQVIAGLKEIYSDWPPAASPTAKTMGGDKKFFTELLIEISAGAGAVIGDSFEELGYILKELGRSDVHVCLDTCHMFASGYDIRTVGAIDETMRQFHKHIGINRLKLVHVNDSKADLGEHKDRHEHIGKGKIGEAGFKVLLAHKDWQKVNFILETKHDSLIKHDMQFLKENRR